MIDSDRTASASRQWKCWIDLAKMCYLFGLQINQSSIAMKEQGLFHDETEQYVQDIKSGNVAMLVVIRVRPLTTREVAIDGSEVVKVLDNKMIILLDTVSEDGEKRVRSREAQFSFDFAYNNAATTKQIYDESLSNLLDGILEGFNSTILAYGATGCGKTYTMIGEQGKEGITALAMIDLLGRANEMRRYKNIIIRISYIEIYNENIKDLLISEDKNLDLREDPKEGMLIPGVTEVTISSMLELATVLKVGAANRSKEATVSNQASSRSHSLLLVKAETKDKAQGIKQQISIGKLTLVDLAGSQRAGGQKGTRQIEGAKINKSLLALGNCIQVLADSNSKNIFVPYRESKLTRLLKQSLGGNCRTAMIVNITPFSGNWQENYNSLVYANRAKNIKNNACRNVLAAEAHVSNYMALIGNLKRENDELKKQLRGGKNQSLPQLKSVSAMDRGQRLEIHRTQNKIDAHFAQELKFIQILSDLTIKIDKAGFKLYRMQLENKKEGKNGRKIHNITEKQQKNEEKLSKTIQELSDQKNGFESKLEDLVFERGTLMNEIKTNDFSQSSISLLISHYREKKVEIQLEEIRFREHRMESQKQEKEKLMNTLGQQLKIRDKIIQEQKLIIQKNNIVNRITYSRLGMMNDSTFPDIFQTLKEAKSLLPQEKSQLTLFQQKNINKQKISQQNSMKHSISKKKKMQQIKNQSLFQPNQEDIAFEKVKVIQSESELFNESKNQPTLKQKKIVRNKSKRKNPQLDFVYMQR